MYVFALMAALVQTPNAGAAADPNVIVGTEKAETIEGTQKDDVIYGLGGADVLFGLDGQDSLLGGKGADVIYGGFGSDKLAGGPGDDYLSGDSDSSTNAGADLLNGGPGVDRLYGLGADDRLVGGAGADFLDGGSDDKPTFVIGRPEHDIADYGASPRRVVVDLGKGAGFGGDATGDTYRAIEDVQGSFFDDRIYGDTAANRIFGGAGDDRLDGGDGDDVLLPGTGTDEVFGGPGIDTLSYADSQQAVEIHVGEPGLNRGAASGETIADVEVYEGGPGDDTLLGSAVADTLRGRGGSDRLVGGDGDDELDGGSGYDGLYGGRGNDRLVSIDGLDTLSGGDGGDLFVLSRYGTSRKVTDFARADGDRIAVVADSFLNVTTKASIFKAGEPIILRIGPKKRTGLPVPTFRYGPLPPWCDSCLTLDTDGIGIGDEQVIAVFDGKPTLKTTDLQLEFASTVTRMAGSAAPNTMADTEGDDLIDPGAGDDTVYVMNGGTDRILGGAGADRVVTFVDAVVTIDYSASASAITFLKGAEIGRGGDAEGDSMALRHGKIVGTAFADVIESRYRFITAVGGPGDDRLRGGYEEDRLLPGTGTNVVDGFEGLDVVSYEDVEGPVTVDLGNSLNNAGEAAGDTIVNVEGAAGTASADRLIGTKGRNRLEGLWGDDTIVGGPGSDDLVGGPGRDVVLGGPGSDTFRFNSPADAGDELDFSRGDGDRIVLSAEGFGGLFTVGQTPLFVADLNPKPKRAKPTILYRRADRHVLIDRDGTGPEPAFFLAVLQAAPKASDFVIE